MFGLSRSDRLETNLADEAATEAALQCPGLIFATAIPMPLLAIEDAPPEL